MSTRDAQRLAAGLKEDARIADGLAFACRLPDRVPDFTACGGPAAEQFWARFTGRRELDEVAAKRQILALQAEFQVKRDQETAHPQYAVEMVCEVLDQVIAALAGVYQDTPAETAR